MSHDDIYLFTASVILCHIGARTIKQCLEGDLRKFLAEYKWPNRYINLPSGYKEEIKKAFVTIHIVASKHTCNIFIVCNWNQLFIKIIS